MLFFVGGLFCILIIEFLVWKTKKLTAKNEKEATDAQLTETKMQVEATDEAENAKKKLHQSS